ncbi:MAG: hypothetical protein FWG51_04380, partial [Firmicutes bacterium]|nr:hypothetical protein [Bacillota bacterium]
VVNVSAEAYEDAFAGGIAGYSFISNYISNCYAAGDVSASGQCAYAGGFVAYSITESESVFNNCYRYEEQIIDAQGPLPIINTEGLECNLSDLNSSEFYIETLLWDLDIWDFTELDFASDKYPQFLNEGRLPLWNP